MRVSCRLASASQRAAAIAAVAVFLAAMAASAAPAQQAPESPPAAWRVECSGDGKTLEQGMQRHHADPFCPAGVLSYGCDQ